MAKIVNGPSEDFFEEAFLKTLPFEKLGWFDGEKFNEAEFVLGPKSYLGDVASPNERITVFLTQVSFKKSNIHFEGQIISEGEKFLVKGKVSRNFYPTQGEIFLK